MPSFDDNRISQNLKTRFCAALRVGQPTLTRARRIPVRLSLRRPLSNHGGRPVQHEPELGSHPEQIHRYWPFGHHEIRVGHQPAPRLDRFAHRTQRLALILCSGREQCHWPRALPAARENAPAVRTTSSEGR